MHIHYYPDARDDVVAGPAVCVPRGHGQRSLPVGGQEVSRRHQDKVQVSHYVFLLG